MKKIVISALIGLGIFGTSFGQGGKDGADKTLRGSGRVNASTLAMEFDLPLGSYPGRGINVPVSLSYSSKLWRMKNVGTTEGGVVTGGCRSLNEATYSENSASGWTTSLATPYIEYVAMDNRFNTRGFPLVEGLCVNAPPEPDNSGTYIRRLTIHLPSGETHELRSDDTPLTYDRGGYTCPPPIGVTYCDPNNPYNAQVWNQTYYAVDGSNIKYVENSTTVPATYRLLMPDGSYYDFEGARSNIYGATARKGIKFTDRNGNYTTFNASTGAWTDTLGKTIPAPIAPTAPAAPTASGSPQVYQMPGMTGVYKFHWKHLKGSSPEESGLTIFNQDLKYPGNAINQISNGNWNWRPAGTYLFGSDLPTAYALSGQSLFNPIVLTEIELPTGQKYKFSYNIYGLIEHITYPTGGSEKFTLNVVAPLTQSFEPNISDQTNFGVTNRKVYETAGQGTPYEWSYSATHVAPSGYVVSITSPDQTRSERFLHQGNQPCSTCDFGTFGYDNGLAGMPYEELSYDSSSPRKLVSRKLTHWAKKSFPGSGVASADWHPRVEFEKTITYDPSGNGDAVSATTTYEYEGDLNLRETPVLVKKTTQYAFEAITGGSSLMDPPCIPDEEPCNPPPNPTPVPTATPPSTSPPVKIVETAYVIYDTATYPEWVRDIYKSKNLVGLVRASTIKNGAGTVVARSQAGYDDGNLSPEIGRGNPTKASVWDSTKGAWDNPGAYIHTYAKFDNYGNQIESVDAKGNITTTTFDSTHNAFPISVTSPVPDPTGTHGSNTAFVTSMTFDYITGLLLTTTDVNGQTTSMEYNDPLLRPTRVIAPNGHQTITEYGAGTSEATRFIKTRSQIDETNWKDEYSWFDGLGRAYKTQTVDSAGDVFTESLFDAFGRQWKTSNPYRVGETKLWSENFYDTAGRLFKVKTPDGSETETAYGVAATGSQIGTMLIVTDQSEKQRRSISNALRQITRVDEPNNTGQLGTVSSPNHPTLYAYDTLNNLTQVQQNGVNAEQCGGAATCSQTRSFAYDSLSRLQQLTNPENGSIQYTYDNNSNLVTKTDPRNIVTTYTYDAFNRVISRVYANEPGGSDTPDVSYFYDNLPNAKGKMLKFSSAVSTTEYTSFDLFGRVTGHKQTTDGQNYTTGYVYSLSGALIEKSYPSTRKVKNVLDNNGDLAIVQSKKNSNHGYLNYADSFTYDSAGAVTSMQLGNGRWESTIFNGRLQPTQIALGTVRNGHDKLKLNYSYGDWIGSSIDATKNNGNIVQQVITVPTVGVHSGFTATQKYYYDSLNRIDDSTEDISGQTWRQDFTYDRYGNRNFVEANTTTLPKNCGTPPNQTVCPADVPIFNPSANTANNRLNGHTFDSSGNTTQNAELRKFTYDGENKQIKIETVDSGGAVTGTLGEYVYDGDGKRVKKKGYTNNILTEETIFVYDATGKLIAEYSSDIVSVNDAKVAYLTSDHLGSPRINTDANGTVTARNDYHPFGEEIATVERIPGRGYASDSIRKRFTGYERDNESELDFAQARYYKPGIGRYLTVDPIIESADPELPGSWNRFAYALNSPYVYVDPSGEKWLQSKANPNEYLWVSDADWVKYHEYYSTYYREADGAQILLKNVPKGSKYEHLEGQWVTLTANVWSPVIERCGYCGGHGLGDANDHILLAASLIRGIIGALTLARAATSLASQTATQTVKSGAQVTVGSRVTVDRSRDVLNHIFKNSTGHLSRQTSAANKERYLKMFEAVGSSPANKLSAADALARGFIKPDGVAAGVHVFTKTLSNGKQVWVHVRNGIVREAGINTGAGVR